MTRMRVRFSGHPDDWPEDEYEEYVAERRARKEREAEKAAREALWAPDTIDVRNAYALDGSDGRGADEALVASNVMAFDRWLGRLLTNAYFLGAEALSDQNAEDRFDGSNTPEFDSLYEEGITYADWKERVNGS